jgi:hypothetical protein
MSNDAKLGLMVGVLGVVVAAVVSVQKPAPQPQPGVAANPVPKDVAKPPAVARPAETPRSPEVLPADLASTPVVRTRREPDATPASRPRNDDDIDP